MKILNVVLFRFVNPLLSLSLFLIKKKQTLFYFSSKHLKFGKKTDINQTDIFSSPNVYVRCASISHKHLGKAAGFWAALDRNRKQQTITKKNPTTNHPQPCQKSSWRLQFEAAGICLSVSGFSSLYPLAC